MTTIYHYQSDTGEYISSGVANKDPIDKLDLIPANATTLTPSTPSSNQAVVFNGVEWLLVADHRGEGGYDEGGDYKEVTQLGVVPDSSWTNEPPTVVVTRMSSLTFLDRFTGTEQDAVISSTILDVKKIYGRMMGADFIDTTDTDTIAGVDGLIAYGLVDSSHKATILAPAS
ncbi:MAG: hypothetical protein JKY52_14465 [Flavobacteriales bacterium]|nr:hypothetical protein [Flavobacteriales bacterium]